jgi:hypothetical protein
LRKEPKPSRGNGLINLLFIVVGGWIVISLYQAGHLDDLLREAGIGYVPITSIEDVTCQELKDSAIGEQLKNQKTGVVSEIVAIRNVEEVSRTQSELVCRGELLAEGNNDVIEITISDWDGEFMIEYRSYPKLFEDIIEYLD